MDKEETDIRKMTYKIYPALKKLSTRFSEEGREAKQILDDFSKLKWMLNNAQKKTE